MIIIGISKKSFVIFKPGERYRVFQIEGILYSIFSYFQQQNDVVWESAITNIEELYNL